LLKLAREQGCRWRLVRQWFDFGTAGDVLLKRSRAGRQRRAASSEDWRLGPGWADQLSAMSGGNEGRSLGQARAQAGRQRSRYLQSVAAHQHLGDAAPAAALGTGWSRAVRTRWLVLGSALVVRIVCQFIVGATYAAVGVLGGLGLAFV